QPERRGVGGRAPAAPRPASPLRRPLLRKPGGFEGLGTAPMLLHSPILPSLNLMTRKILRSIHSAEPLIFPPKRSTATTSSPASIISSASTRNVENGSARVSNNLVISSWPR